MIMTNKIVAVALITALIGASLGAAVMHSRDTSRVAETSTTVPVTTNADATTDARFLNASEQKVPSEFSTTEEQTAYKVGFTDGFQAALDGRNVGNSSRSNGVVYRRTSANRSSANSRRVYYY
jgi:hypothetical protein